MKPFGFKIDKIIYYTPIVTIMGEFVCPKQLTVKIPPYHQAIVERAMRSGRYGTASEFFRECIEVYGEQRGFAPAEDSSLSPRARQADINP